MISSVLRVKIRFTAEVVRFTENLVRFTAGGAGSGVAAPASAPVSMRADPAGGGVPWVSTAGRCVGRAPRDRREPPPAALIVCTGFAGLT